MRALLWRAPLVALLLAGGPMIRGASGQLPAGRRLALIERASAEPCCACPQTVPLFVAVGIDALATSDDGAAWTSRSVPEGQWNSVAFGGGIFLVVSGGTDRLSMYSTNGVDWLPGGALPGSGFDAYKHVIFDGLRFVAVGMNGVTGTTVVATSSTGSAWNAVSTSGLPTNFQGYSIAYSGTTYVMGGSGSNPTNLQISTNLAAWTPKNAANLDYKSVTFAGGRFVALSSSNSYAAWSGNDGASFSTVFHTYGGNTAVNDGIASSGTLFVGPVLNRMISSVNGAAPWTPTSTPNITGGVAWSATAGLFVAVGNGVAIVAPDGLTWTQYVFPFDAVGIGAR